jgi:hypothetical protein
VCTFKEIHSALLKTSNCKVIVVGQPSSSLRLLQGGLLQGMIPSAFITLKMGVVAGDCWCWALEGYASQYKMFAFVFLIRVS